MGGSEKLYGWFYKVALSDLYTKDNKTQFSKQRKNLAVVIHRTTHILFV